MKFLITGATGKVGRHLVNQLIADGHQVRALTRNPEAANFPTEVEVVAGDLTLPETLAEAFDGVVGIHLINFSDFGNNDYVRLQTGEAIVALAKKAGVQRVTILGDHEIGNVEEAVMASGLGWTLLRPVGFMGNAIGDWAESICNEGVVRQAFIEGKGAVVHEGDIAAVAATALTQTGHEGKTYDITGPEALTISEMIAIIGQVIGRDIQLIELTEEQARERWQAEGYSNDDIEFFVWMQSNPPSEAYTVLDTVERVTGKPARTFTQWAAEHIQHFQG